MTQAWVTPTTPEPAASGEMAAGVCTQVPQESAVRELMWTDVGLTRTREGLARAVLTLSGWRNAMLATSRADASGLRAHRRISSLTTVGFLIARAALRREESRGGHYRSDFPARDDIHWRLHLADRLDPVDRPTYRA
jgi:succinate dehydrogenase/fumarate reductase flavoprotein subunit